MSLINDALKRVSEAERGKPAQQTDFETRSLQPAEYERRSSPVLWIALPVLIAAVGIGGFLLAKQKQPAPTSLAVVAKSSQVEPPKDVPAVAPDQATAPVVEVKPTPVASQPVAPISKAPAPVSQAPAEISTTAHATPAPTAQAAQAAPTPAQPAPAPVPIGPTFRLKGILYTKNPTALINDGSAQVGGEIDGATITKIDRTSVELNYQGKVTVLKLGVH